MNGILINDQFHEPSYEEVSGNKCKHCSLSEVCNNYYCQLYNCVTFVSKGLVKVTQDKSKILDTSFVAEPFKNIVNEWLDYKKSRREKYKSDKSLKVFYNQLLKLSNNNPLIAQEIINQSIANNWAGIFALKNESNRRYSKRDINQSVFTQYLADKARLEQGITDNEPDPY